jgi:hypothetical protein
MQEREGPVDRLYYNEPIIKEEEESFEELDSGRIGAFNKTIRDNNTFPHFSGLNVAFSSSSKKDLYELSKEMEKLFFFVLSFFKQF